MLGVLPQLMRSPQRVDAGGQEFNAGTDRDHAIAKKADANPGRKGDGKAARREKNIQLQEKVKQSGEYLNDKI